MRPENWRRINPDPCVGCPNIQLDMYGYLCDLACGKRTAYLNREAGADAMLEGLKKGGVEYRNWMGQDAHRMARYVQQTHLNPKGGWLVFIEDE